MSLNEEEVDKCHLDEKRISEAVMAFKRNWGSYAASRFEKFLRTGKIDAS